MEYVWTVSCAGLAPNNRAFRDEQEAHAYGMSLMEVYKQSNPGCYGTIPDQAMADRLKSYDRTCLWYGAVGHYLWLERRVLQ